MKKIATVSLSLNPYQKSDLRSLYLKVYFNKKSTYYSLGGTTKLSKEDFVKKNKNYKNAFEEIRTTYQKATDIASTLEDCFNFDDFSEAYTDATWSNKKKTSTKNILLTELYAEYINSRRLAPNTITDYNILVDWIERFHANTKLKDITPEMLTELTTFIKQHSLKLKGKETKETSISAYLRGLRAVFNYAITKNYIGRDKYPFGKEGYRLTGKVAAKKALTDEEFEKFLSYSPNGYKEKLGYDFFFISYYLQGLNLADIIRLKNKNINGDIIELQRWKTRNTKQEKEVLEIDLYDEAKAILNKYGKIEADKPNEYILRFLKSIEETDIKAQDLKKSYLNKNINKGLKSICNKLNIKTFTFYSGRHSFVTDTINDNSANISVISKLLGHSDISVTMGYVDSISQENKAKIKETVLKRRQKL